MDLEHYYQEPYQDENDEIKDMGKPFETDESKKIRTFDLSNEDRTYSGFSYFMDGSRRTYKIGDMVLEGKKMISTQLAYEILKNCCVLLYVSLFREVFSHRTCENAKKVVSVTKRVTVNNGNSNFMDFYQKIIHSLMICIDKILVES